MLFKLSIKNIKKSIKDYAIYFFTLVLGVAIFYVFNSINSSVALLDINQTQKEIIELLNTLLGSISVFVCIVLGFLIIYASQFLIKRRKKEFGIYMILGMGKKELSKILLLETLLIGMLSLVVGLLLGVFASQFMSMFVASLFAADMSSYVFTFSFAALSKTVIFFIIIYVFVMLFNTFSISKCKLIDLINASKRSEKIKVKNPLISIVIFVLSISMLAFAYYEVTSQGISINMDFMGIMIVLGCLGSFLFFWSFSGLLLKMMQGNKRLYLKNLNMFVVRQLNSKVNTAVISMSLISIMLFMTICILSSGLSFNESLTSGLEKMAPVDLNLQQLTNVDSKDNIYTSYYRDAGAPNFNIEEVLLSNNTILENLNLAHFDAGEKLKDVFEYKEYMTNEVKMKNTLAESATEKFPNLNIEAPEVLMKISDYNKLAELYGSEQFDLKGEEYIILCDFESMLKLRNEGLKQNPIISLGGKNFTSKYNECQNGYTVISPNYANSGIILLPDDALSESIAFKRRLIANYNADDQETYDAIESSLNDFQQTADNVTQQLNGIGFHAISKGALYQASVGLGAIGTFIGIYLGIVFLISSAAILALKELSDSSDNKERYTVLRKIGVDERMISKALFIQIGVFFLLPVALAIFHSIFGIQFCIEILSAIGTDGLLPSIVMTSLFILLIYGGYFLITYFCSRNIIREK